MKKYIHFICLVFIVSIVISSCKKNDNPVTNSTGGGSTTTTYASFNKNGLNKTINNGYTFDTISAVVSDNYLPANYISDVKLVLDSIIGVDASQLKFDLIHQNCTVRAIDTLIHGGPNNNFIHTTLSDSVTDPIRTASSPFTGVFQPTNSFRIFRDLPPEGNYILRILNSGNIRTGVIKSWGITVNYSPRISNYCLEFDGVNQCAVINNSTSINSILTNRTFTIEGWYRVIGYTSNYFSFLDKQNSWYFEYSKPDTAWTFVVPGPPTAKAHLEITTNTWYHIAVTYDGNTNTLKFYSNGQLINTLSKSYSFATNTNPLYVAYGISGSPEHGKGRYDEIRIWNIARTDAEIASNYNKILSGGENGLVMYLKLNEGSGDIVYDTSPNVNNGTLLDGPIWSKDGPTLNP
jgi:hypothetical protein